MSDVRIDLNSRSIEAFLKSAGMQALMLKHAEAMADRAGPGFSADVVAGANRAHAQVWAETADARRAEATGRALTRAVRGG